MHMSDRLLERDETRRVRGTDTGPSVLDRVAAITISGSSPKRLAANFVGVYVLRDRKLRQIMTDHLGLDLDLVELLAGVDADDGADHLGHDDHVAQVRLDEIGLLVGLGLLLGFAQLLDQAHGLALQAAVEPAAGACVDDIAELLGGEVEESGE